MDLPKSKFGIPNDDIVDVMNLKCDPVLIGSLLKDEGIFPAYHMSKGNWISVMLDGSVDEEKIKFLIDMSFCLTDKKHKRNEEKV
jgi:predicted DNA-binding protein (MmcQ/YjbR family)